jgi:hypothetical protein
VSGINATVVTRVKGKAAITKSLRSLLIRTHRYGRHRAATPEDLGWAAQLIDALTAAVETADRDDQPTENRPCGTSPIR